MKTKFFGFPFRLSAAFDDPRLGSIRGWNLRESSVAALMRLIADPRTTARVVGKDTMVGRPMTLIEVRGPLLLPGTDRELVYVDDTLKLPFVIEAWDGHERALRLEVETFAIDAPLSPGAFTLD